MRADLLRLTPEALAQLANLGLVKRAQRELGSGYVPTLTLSDEGRLLGVFPDQVSTEFAPNAGLKEATCSCGAPLCRHRIALVLHYAATAGADESSAPPPLASFQSLSDAEVRAQIAATLWPLVERELRQGISIEVERSPAGDNGNIVYTARLPNATARYYAGADLAFARCDCTAQQRCLHIALGALALRDAPQLAEARMTIALRTAANAAQPSAALPGFAPEPYRALLGVLLRDGLAHGAADNAATASALNAALSASRKLGATWLTLCLEAIEQWLDSYQRRSARFSLGEGVALLRELALRTTLAESNGGQLTPRAVLGVGEAMESALDRLTLLSLGLRIESDGPHRHATLAVFDTDTQTLLSLQRSWQRDPAATHSELALLDQQRIAGSLRLTKLALGSLVTTTAKRRANGELRLGQSFAGKASISLQNGDWSGLRTPLLVESQSRYLRQQQLAPPLALAARTALPGFHVLRVQAVVSIGFDPASQRLSAMLADADDEVWWLQRDYASATPGALDAVASTLQAANPSEVPLYVAGQIRRSHAGLIIEPWALSAGAMVVPDMSAANGALATVALNAAPGDGNDTLAAYLGAIDECLCDLLRDGARRQSGLSTRLKQVIERTRELGLYGSTDENGNGIGNALQSLHVHLSQLHSGDAAAMDRVLSDVVEVLIWSGLAQHAITSIDNEEDIDATV